MAKIKGTARNDIINATHAGTDDKGHKVFPTDEPDQIFGLAGGDRLEGLGGGDDIDGGAGRDDISGGAGQDSLVGGTENDTIFGGDDQDSILGGTGNDLLRGENSSDRIFGEEGNDSIVGGEGIDFLFGDEGRDTIRGGDTGDNLYVTKAREVVAGEIYDGGGELGVLIDSLFISDTQLVDLSIVTLISIEDITSAGRIHANADQISGKQSLATGKITFLTAGLVDLVNKTVITSEFKLNPGGNDLDLTGCKNAFYTVEGGSGADVISGGDRDTGLANSSAGGDLLAGLPGDDLLIGRAGNDTLDGGIGDDTVFGSAGEDTARFAQTFEHYKIEKDAQGFKVTDIGTAGEEGVDRIREVENFQFADGFADPEHAFIGWEEMSTKRAATVGEVLVRSSTPGGGAPSHNVLASLADDISAADIQKVHYTGTFSASQILTRGYDFGDRGGSIGPSIFLTTGKGDVSLTNTKGDFTVRNNTPGDADLDKVAAAAGRDASHDAASITFTLKISDAATHFISFDMIMGSEEATTAPPFGDLAAVFVNGVNQAKFDGDAERILSLNQDFAPVVLNSFADPLPIEYSGITKLLNVVAPVHLGFNTIKIAIADLSDSDFDSGLFIGNLQGLLTGAAGMYVHVDGTGAPDDLAGGALPELFALGLGNDTVHAGDGNDLVRGNTGNDVLFGETGSDLLDGGSSADTLNGGAGNDTLNGGAKADSLQGLGGRDTFVFDTALGSDNIDTIVDYNVAADTIRLENAVFAGLAVGKLAATAFHTGSAAADASDRIIYNDVSGALLFDADGTGGGAAIKFASLAAGLAMTNADFAVI